MAGFRCTGLLANPRDRLPEHLAAAGLIEAYGAVWTRRSGGLSAAHRPVRLDASFADRPRCHTSACCFARCRPAGAESGCVARQRAQPVAHRFDSLVGDGQVVGGAAEIVGVADQGRPPVADLPSVSVRSDAGYRRSRCRSSSRRRRSRPLALASSSANGASALRCRGGRYSLAFARATPATRRFLPNRLTLAVFRSSRRPRGQRGTPGKHGPDEEETAWLIHHQITTTRVREGEFSNDFHAAGQLKTKPG
jgi:hypothetical protein